MVRQIDCNPSCSAQVSDLTDLDRGELVVVRGHFKWLVNVMEESFDMSREVISDPEFPRLGLTDAAVAKVCSRGILVLTADFDLYAALQRREMDAVNLNHIRPLGW